YESFALGFAPFLDALPDSDVLALKLRLLIVAEFRRIALADPGLPTRLLPEAWPGREARRIAAELHSAVAQSAEGERDRLLEWAPGETIGSIPARRFRD
ncbi:MAG: PaaX family transcriptional regulator C-terminal domain-containing protein, partial [Ilumatobacter sp.]